MNHDFLPERRVSRVIESGSCDGEMVFKETYAEYHSIQLITLPFDTVSLRIPQLLSQ